LKTEAHRGIIEMEDGPIVNSSYPPRSAMGRVSELQQTVAA
jgi:hypothetical protein